MKKIVEKVILIALICVTFIFALTTILYVTNVIPQQDVSDNSVAVILLSVLAVVYLGLSAWLIYLNFSERVNVKRILLFYDAESATRASGKVVDNIVNGCAKQVSNVKIRRTKIRVDEKLGLIATIHVELAAKEVTVAIPQLRALLEESFRDTLGLKFNAINFEIDKLTKKFVPDTTNEKPDDTTPVAEEPVELPADENETVSEPSVTENTELDAPVDTVEKVEIAEN